MSPTAVTRRSPSLREPDAAAAPGQVGRLGLRILSALRVLVAEAAAPYAYVEVGSFLGRTLVDHLASDVCARALSIDLRPAVAADERGPVKGYDRATEAEMRSVLAGICGDDALDKLETLTATSDAIVRREDPGLFDFAFIDGEHTVEGVFRDFVNVYCASKPDAVIAFDDTPLVLPAILNALTVLELEGRPVRPVFFKGGITAFLIGAYADREPNVAPRQKMSEAEARVAHRAAAARASVARDLPALMREDKTARAAVRRIVADWEG